MHRPKSLLAFGLWLAVTVPASALADQTPEQQLQATERTLDAARQQQNAAQAQDQALLKELTGLQRHAVELAATTQDTERDLGAIEDRLAALQAELETQRANYGEQRARQIRALAALERLALAPPAARVFAPGEPVDVARGGLVLAAVVPQLKAQVSSLQSALQKLTATEQELTREQEDADAREHSLIDEREKVDQAEADRTKAEGETRARADAAQKRVELLTAEAHDLRQLVDRLAHEREAAAPPPVPQPVVAAPPSPGPEDTGGAFRPGALLAPVVGEIVKQYGATEAFGTAKGLTFTTRPKAEVIAPFAGEVMFAGPFRGYGQILIIDHGDGYHSVLAGIDRIIVPVGRRLASGEPIGFMTSDGQPSLYLELRHRGQAVDPFPWLAAHNGKAS